MSSAKGRVPQGLIDTTLVHLEAAWKEREEEAKGLSGLGFHSTAAALRLYALEILVKVVICKHLNLPSLPAACKSHNLVELLVYTGAWREMQDPSCSLVRENWDTLVEYSRDRLNDLRYEPRTELTQEDVARIDAALDEPDTGVLAWLSKRT
ncbi:hypothetical protein [Paludisphaera rhizosphaerae]|uniref:hypothetical protein n=1 Tax=Paludisphaera rhizosphaerae TaxID=2711216 RepID=UPI0013EDFA80|nr:hypothetical protein [Paludisphaera rhizosphaerae]